MASGTYIAVKHYGRTGRSEILFNGKPIPHIPYTKSSADDFTWGYKGAGPSNVARSILEHAVDIENEDIRVDPAAVQFEFRDQYVSPHETHMGGWTVDHSEVIEFLKTRTDD